MVIAAVSFLLTSCAPESLTPNQIEIQTLVDNQDYQGAIDKAIELYGIDTHGIQPTYDPNLKSNEEDTLLSGLTTPYDYKEIDGVLVGGRIEVSIGPDAFSSPDTLVGTLVHESVHIEQWQEERWYASAEGYWLNEVEAYDYVAGHKDEFELSRDFLKVAGFWRKVYFGALPSSLKDRVRNGIYTLPK